MYDPEEVDTTHLMTRELGPILRDYDIQHLLDDVEDAVYAGVPYELPSELVEEPQGPEGQQGQQGQEGQVAATHEADQPQGQLSRVETPAEVETLAEGPSDSLIVAPQTTAYPTPPESSFHALIEAFANVSFHAEIQRGITFKPHRHQLPPAPKNYQNM